MKGIRGKVRECVAADWREYRHLASSRPVVPSTSQADQCLVHLADELVDVGLPVAEVTTLDEVLELPCPPAASGVGELERPEEVVGLLEVRASGEDLVDEIFDGEDVVLAEGLLDDLVVGKGDALLVDLSVAALVDKLTDGLQVGLAAFLSDFSLSWN